MHNMNKKGEIDFMKITYARQEDLKDILKLQYLSYQSEALLHNNYLIQPLTQSLEEVLEEFKKGTVLKGIDDDGNIIGSIRGYTEGNIVFIGKIMVHPDYQGKGYGSQLINAMEEIYPNHRYELFTSNKSIKNLNIYKHLGYVRFKEENISTDLKLIYLEKYRQ